MAKHKANGQIKYSNSTSTRSSTHQDPRPLRCDHCVKLNLPCDGTAPCDNCYHDGEVCDYSRCRCNKSQCPHLHHSQQNPWDGSKVEGNFDDICRDIDQQAKSRTSHITRAWNEYQAKRSRERRARLKELIKKVARERVVKAAEKAGRKGGLIVLD